HSALPLLAEEVDRGAQLEAVPQAQVAPLVAAADGDAVGGPAHVGLVAEATPPAEVDADDVVGDRYRGRRRGHQRRRRGRVGGRLRRRRLGLCPQRSENGRREHRARDYYTIMRGNPRRVPAPSHDRLRPAKPGSVYAIMRGNPRRVRAPSRDRLRPAKPGSVYAITTRSCPASTAVPSAQRTAVTRPARGARSSFSIFIASRTTTVWPACTVSSALTSSLTTRPGIGERIVTGAASFPARAGAAILARRASATSAASASGSAPGRRISMVSFAPAPSTA